MRLTDCMKKKGLVIGNMIGMGFDGAATFSGRYNGVQALLNLTQFLRTATATGLCSSCKQYSRHQTCLHNTNYTLEILSLYTECSEYLKCQSLGYSQALWHTMGWLTSVVSKLLLCIVIALNNIYEETHEPKHWELAKPWARSLPSQLCFYYRLCVTSGCKT